MSPISRRTAITRILGAVAAAPLGLHGLAAPRSALAQEAIDPLQTAPTQPASSTGPLSNEPGYHFWSLSDPSNGPVRTGVTFNEYDREIGYAAFENGAFVIHHHYNKGLRGQEWISSRIGDLSILDGALMVQVRGLYSDIGCFGLEMRHQAYKDRRYIRSNWLMIDPPTSTVELETDGIWNDMVELAEVDIPGQMYPLHEWNQLLFIARGFHFEGWVNGVKALEGQNTRFGRGRASLVAVRMTKALFRTEFRNLHVWDGIVPDPTTVWG
jgi:hypothetical protein